MAEIKHPFILPGEAFYRTTTDMGTHHDDDAGYNWHQFTRISASQLGNGNPVQMRDFEKTGSGGAV